MAAAIELQTHPAPVRDDAGPIEVLRRWQHGLRINHMAQYQAAAHCAQLGRGLGLAVVALTTVVGTTLFATLSQSPSNAVKIGAGMLSVAAALCSALQTFLAYPQRQADHHAVGGRYGALRREIETLLAAPPGEPQLAAALQDIRTRWDEIDRSAPAVPPKIFGAAREAVLGSDGVRVRDGRGER
ncbi:MAG TPA: SLATT domain-containing protein [Conexibacter sp.]|nr:SLATT domain-containing protein [Conexibacter sp.]